MLKDTSLSCHVGKSSSLVVVTNNDICIRDNTKNKLQFKANININLIIEGKPFTSQEMWVTINGNQSEILIRMRLDDWKTLRELLEGLVIFKGFHRRYILLDLIANSSAMIYRCQDIETQVIWIAKICDRKTSRDELKISAFLKRNSHKNILVIRELFQQNSNYIIITPIMKGGTLNEYAFHHKQNKSEEDVQNIMIQILEGLAFLHKFGIMHRDIKMDNIMLEKNNQIDTLKIIDFGFATLRRSELSRCGTPGYIAPEVFLLNDYTELCDIYSLSSVFHTLFCGTKMFSSNGNLSDLNQQNCIQKSRELSKNQLANELFDSMNCEHQKRITVFQCLEHPYFFNVSDDESTISFLHSITFPNSRNQLMEFQ